MILTQRNTTKLEHSCIGSVQFAKGPFDTVEVDTAYAPSLTMTIRLKTGETLCVDYSAVEDTLDVTVSSVVSTISGRWRTY
jgi:hypothetical protein